MKRFVSLISTAFTRSNGALFVRTSGDACIEQGDCVVGRSVAIVSIIVLVERGQSPEAQRRLAEQELLLSTTYTVLVTYDDGCNC